METVTCDPFTVTLLKRKDGRRVERKVRVDGVLLKEWHSKGADFGRCYVKIKVKGDGNWKSGLHDIGWIGEMSGRSRGTITEKMNWGTAGLECKDNIMKACGLGYPIDTGE